MKQKGAPVSQGGKPAVTFPDERQVRCAKEKPDNLSLFLNMWHRKHLCFNTLKLRANGISQAESG